MEKITDEEVAVISAVISAYLDSEISEKDIVPFSKWHYFRKKDGLNNAEILNRMRKGGFSVQSKWKLKGKLELLR